MILGHVDIFILEKIYTKGAPCSFGGKWEMEIAKGIHLLCIF